MTKAEDSEEIRDYSLVGREASLALERGLADATWYTSPIPRDQMRKLLERRDGPAIRDTLIWFGLIIGSAVLVTILWGTWWFIIPYVVYSVLYASSSDSRWHESSHGTAFKTGWMNDLLYEIASFMVLRQSTVWRWSHTRHHSDTLVRGRDPEIAAPRPPQIKRILMSFFGLRSAPAEFRKMFIHASGRIDKQVATYLPESEYRKVYWKARIYLLIFAATITLSIVLSTPLPVMFIGLPTLVGTWLMPIYGLTQHAGLAENVLDHRLNCRTVYMNRVHRFLYWNMNYHIEHHMFPMVPYHALPKLHLLMKEDCPPPYKSIAEAFREIIPTLMKQVKDPSYFAVRTIPEGSRKMEEGSPMFKASLSDADELGYVRVCSVDELPKNEVLRFDLDDQTFAVYKTENDQCHITEGICTHGNTHLSDGMVVGDQIECPKHNGRFSILDGSPQRPPVCDALKTYETLEKDGYVFMGVKTLVDGKEESFLKKYQVVSNQNVATFIKELVLEPIEENAVPEYRPGEYLKLEIPQHQTRFQSMEVIPPFERTWKELNAFRYHSFNHIRTRRNYSMATNPNRDKVLKFNVRIALPPPGMNCDAGFGSSYVFNLKPGDEVQAEGPFGDFHVMESEREMVYVGGGAGMAPLRSHISWLFDSRQTKRKVSFWYGARSKGELFYEEYFRELADRSDNFSFQVALSEPLKEDKWDSYVGYIHEVLEREFLSRQKTVSEKEYYLCGPPEMVAAVQEVLKRYKVPEEQIAFDEF